MNWLWWVLGTFLAYEIASVVAFFWIWSKRSKTGKSPWYDWIWWPGIFLVIILLRGKRKHDH